MIRKWQYYDTAISGSFFSFNYLDNAFDDMDNRSDGNDKQT